MLLVEPLTTDWPVAPGTLGFVAADELFMFGLLGFVPDSCGLVLVPEADGLLTAGVGCAIAAIGAAINVAANSNERAFVIIVLSFRTSRRDIPNGYDR